MAELKPCGTQAAYQRHRKRGETPCQPCVEANRAYMRKWRGGDLSPRELEPCGTRAAYMRHRRNDEEPCQACKDANNAATKNYPGFHAYQRARQRAFVQLSKRYPEAYAELLAQEKAKETTR